jgi:hypothetical protein
MKITPQMIWDGLPPSDRVALKHGAYAVKHPALHQLCMPLAAEEAFVNVLAGFLIVDAERTDA